MDDELYFYRNVIISVSGKDVFLIDIFNPDSEKTALNSWFGLIIQLANGQHKINELYSFVASKYESGAPDNLQETIMSVIKRMVESKLIMLTEAATELPYYLSLPYESLDLEKAKKLILKDRANVN